IRRLDPSTGEVVTIAGDPGGTPGFVDTSDIDKDHATERFDNPIGIAIDATGVIYISDFGNEVIRRMVINNGSVTVDTIAGESKKASNDDGTKDRIGLMGYVDDVPTRSTFSGPYGIVLDRQGNLLVADSFNNVIRKIIMSNGTSTA